MSPMEALMTVLDDVTVAMPDDADEIMEELARLGFAIVPKEADEVMWQAGKSADEAPGDSYTKVYCAMVEAASR